MTWVDDIEHRAKAYESHPGGLRQLTRLDIPRLTEALREAMAVMEGALSDAICGCCARSVRSTREPLCRCSGPMKVDPATGEPLLDANGNTINADTDQPFTCE